jgi:hypothetical protein
MASIRGWLMIGFALAATGCGLLVSTAVVGTAVVVGTVGAVGYTVYKGGEAVVSGVAAVGSGAKSLVVSDGTLETEADHSIEQLYCAAQSVMKEADFRNIQGTKDGMSGVLSASTAFSEPVEVKFRLVKENRTSIAIKVGDGNLEQAELIHDRMLAKLGIAGGQG